MNLTVDCFRVPLTITLPQAFSRLPRGNPNPHISFSSDIVIYHSDIRQDNFLHDIRTGKIWIVDFQHIGALPEPFQTYAFFNTGNPFAAAVGTHLGHEPSDIADRLTKASCLLYQSSGYASLGMYSASLTDT